MSSSDSFKILNDDKEVVFRWPKWVDGPHVTWAVQASISTVLSLTYDASIDWELTDPNGGGWTEGDGIIVCRYAGRRSGRFSLH